MSQSEQNCNEYTFQEGEPGEYLMSCELLSNFNVPVHLPLIITILYVMSSVHVSCIFQVGVISGCENDSAVRVNDRKMMVIVVKVKGCVVCHCVSLVVSVRILSHMKSSVKEKGSSSVSLRLVAGFCILSHMKISVKEEGLSIV